MTDPNDPRDPRTSYIGIAALAALVILAILLFNVDPTPESVSNAPATPPPGSQP